MVECFQSPDDSCNYIAALYCPVTYGRPQHRIDNGVGQSGGIADCFGTMLAGSVDAYVELVSIKRHNVRLAIFE